MRRRELLGMTGAAAFSLLLPNSLRAAPEPRRKLLFFTKSAGFEHSACHRDQGQLAYNERVLMDLGQRHGFDVHCSKDGTIFDGDLDQYDAFFFYTTGDLTQTGTDGQPAMTAKGKAQLLESIAAGKGFVASHCAADTFHSDGPIGQEQEQVDPYIAMLGGEFISHGAQQKARQIVTSESFPGLAGQDRWMALNEEWYSLKNFADDLHVILVQDTAGMEGKEYQRPPYPSTWARRHGKGRVFYTSMGHREDVWDNDAFQNLLVGALSWAWGSVDMAISPNLAQVAPDAHVMPPA